MAAQPKQQPFQWTKVPIPFAGGVDTRSDRKVIPLPKLGLLENAVFTTPGVLRKRNGYSKLAELALDSVSAGFFDQPITDAVTLLARGTSLWLRSSSNVYSLSPDRSRWQREAQVPNGKFVYGRRYFSSTQAVGADRATANGVTLVTYNDFGAPSTVTCIFYDHDGTELVRTSFAGLTPRAVVVGTSICLFYQAATSFDKIFCATFDTTAIRSGNPLGFPVATVASDLKTSGGVTFDADVSGGRIVLAYITTTANTLKFGYVLPGGALDGAMTTISTAFVPATIACAVEPTAGTILVVWLQTGTPRVDGQMFNAAKASLFAIQTLGTPSAVGGEQVACVFRDATTAEIFLDFLLPALPAGSRVEKATLTTAGVPVLFSGWLRHSAIMSKPWTVAGRVYLLVVRASESAQLAQRTFFLVASGGVRDPSPLGPVYPNEARQNLDGTSRKPCRADLVGSTVWLTPQLVRLNDALSIVYYPGNVGVDYSHIPTAIEAGNATYFTGTSLWMLDGADVVETGFAEFPEIDANAGYVATSTTGGALVGGATNSYSYRAYYEWFSATGEQVLSTCGGDIAVPLGVGLDTITIKIPTLRQTLKQGVSIALYRSLLNGSIFHRVATKANDTTVDTVTFVDTMSDTTAAALLLDYRSSSPPELPNLVPPAGSVVAVGNSRVLLAGFEDPDQILASKLRFFGTGLQFAGTAIAIQLPGSAANEPITAIAPIGDSHVAFRETHMYLIGGDGPDNVGSGGGFNPPRVISDDIGCVSASSVVRTPLGLMFKSRKGIYLLGGDMSLAYVGADVEAYNGDTVTAGVALPDRHEVRFTLSSGKTLVFDYLAKQWSVFTIGGLHAVVWQGRHVYLPDATGSARAELAGSYVDDGQPFSWAFETAWIHVGENQNHQRVRTIQLLGEWMGDHGGLVQIGYNYEKAWSDSIAFDVSAVINGEHYGDDVVYGGYLAGNGGNYGGNVSNGLVSTGVYQVKLQPRRMRCQSIRLRWEETRRVDPAGIIIYPWLEGARLNEVALEIGLRGGLWQPGLDRTFGGG